MKHGEDAEEFTLSRKWLVPRIILQPSMGKSALTNISFLVADEALSCEDILIGLPVLRHLKIDIRTILESHRESLDGMDCSKVGNPTTLAQGSVGRLMVARIQQVRGKTYDSGLEYQQRSERPHPDSPRVYYYRTRV